MRFAMNTSYRDYQRLFPHRGAVLSYAMLAVVLLALPLVAGGYLLTQATFVFVNGTVALGLMLLVGYTGLISLGHAAFFAVGAYTAAVLEVQGIPFVPALVGAGLLTGIIGIVIGLPALRMRGIYLAMATLAFAFIVDEVIERWSSVTRGNRGMMVPDASIFGLKLDSGTHVYYIALVVFALVLIALINIVRSRTGRALAAIRDSEIAAASMGINVAIFKTTAFALSATATGLAGAVYAHKLGYISPEQFDITLSIEFLIMVIIGGLGSIHGAVFGAIFVVVLPQLIILAKPYLPHVIAEQPILDAAAFGVLVILFVMFEPSGLNGYWIRIKAWFALFPFYRPSAFKRSKIGVADLVRH
jgi:branched-chain amino acid transport system permease protein